MKGLAKKVAIVTGGSSGIGLHGSIEKFPEEDWDTLLAVNLKGVFLCSKAVFPIMKRQREGYIVNISSLSGKMGMAGIGAYCASKFGVIGLTETLIEEGMPYSIKATAICPAYVNTPMVAGAPVPASRMIQPEDIAATVLFLLSLSDYAIIKEIIIERKGAD